MISLLVIVKSIGIGVRTAGASDVRAGNRALLHRFQLFMTILFKAGNDIQNRCAVLQILHK